MIKTIVKFGANAGTTTETVNESTQVGTYSTGIAWNSLKNGAWKMDVIINVSALTGTSVTFTVKERFSDIGFVETAKTAAITATGVYVLCHEPCESTVETTKVGYFGMLGKGGDKQVVITDSSITALTATIYFVFYNEE